MAERSEGHGPLFRFRDDRPLTRMRFVAKVKGALTTAGMDYSGHSFRMGAATTAAQQGISDATIKMLGRWNNAYQLPTIYEDPKRITWVVVGGTQLN